MCIGLGRTKRTFVPHASDIVVAAMTDTNRAAFSLDSDTFDILGTVAPSVMYWLSKDEAGAVEFPMWQAEGRGFN